MFKSVMQPVILVEEREGDTVQRGFVTIEPWNGMNFMRMLFVNQKYRGQGVANRLIERCKELSPHGLCVQPEPWADESMGKATLVELYKARGFAPLADFDGVFVWIPPFDDPEQFEAIAKSGGPGCMACEPTLQLREGAWYEDRKGCVVGPAMPYDHAEFKWTVGGNTFRDDGTWSLQGHADDTDLIREVPPPASKSASKHRPAAGGVSTVCQCGGVSTASG